MFWPITLQFVGFAVAVVVLPAPRGRAEEPHVLMAALAQSHCSKCHKGKTAEAEIDLDRLTRGPLRLSDYRTWEKVIRVLASGEMPPKGEKVLPAVERDKAVEPLLAAVQRMARSQAGDPGVAVRGRLSNAEYDNAIRDLTGLTLRLTETFPQDGSGGEGFSNVGGLLSIASASAFEKYLQAARKVSEAAVIAPKLGLHFVNQPPGNELKTNSLGKDEIALQLFAFARKAWRRPLSDMEKAEIVKHFDKIVYAGESHGHAARIALMRILSSPNFLFKNERSLPGKNTHLVSQHELAARLSFFLWSSIPDEELSRLADEGKLDDQTLREQVSRMLADPKAKALAVEFFGQWLGFKGFDLHARTDLKKFPSFIPALRQEMYDESVQFFRDLVQSDRPVPDIVFGDATFLNYRLAQHYQLDPAKLPWPSDSIYADPKAVDKIKKDPRGPQPVVRVSLGKHERGGVLGMASVLTVTSTPLRTAPSIRGKWLYETILGRDIPEPPADVGMIPEDMTKSASIRQQLEKHRTQASCASCHARFDPLGFSLEGFDAIGRFRAKEANGQPVDDLAELGGVPFRGVNGLRDYLRAHEEEILRNFSKKLVGYALSRSIAPADQALIDEMIADAAKRENRFSSFVQTLVHNRAFRHRRAADFVDPLNKE